MVVFAYNNSKNASMGHTPFKLNYGYHPSVSFEDKCNARSRSFSAERLAIELRELMNIYCQNFLHAQDLLKQALNKVVKPWIYASGEKVWLNSKHIKTKRNQKLRAKFFGLFWVLHSFEKQVYKLKLPKNWRIYDVFYVSLLEQDTTRKWWMNKFLMPEFEPGDKKEY